MKQCVFLLLCALCFQAVWPQYDGEQDETKVFTIRPAKGNVMVFMDEVKEVFFNYSMSFPGNRSIQMANQMPPFDMQVADPPSNETQADTTTLLNNTDITTTLATVPVTTTEVSIDTASEDESADGGPDYKIIVEISVSDSKLIEVLEPKTVVVNASASGQFAVLLHGILPGRSEIKFVSKLQNGTLINEQSYAVALVKKQGFLDQMFTIVVQALVFVANMGLGCTIDLGIVKANLKKPSAPAIGLFSQFIIMPLIAFAAVNVVDLDKGMSLGLFTLGIAPGGSNSNMLTFLLGGDVSLSITMTFISTVCATGMIPLWMYTLGTFIIAGTDVEIPFTSILQSLALIISPIILGVLTQKFLPKVAKFAGNNVKYLMGLFICFVLTVGLYVNAYIFRLMNLQIMLAAAMLPYLGFFLGGLVAFLLRRDRKTVMTIAVETGIQNTGISMLILRNSLVGPEAATAIVAPLFSSLLTPVPLWCVIVILGMRKRIIMRRMKQRGEEPQVEMKSPAEQKEIEAQKNSEKKKQDEPAVELKSYTQNVKL